MNSLRTGAPVGPYGRGGSSEKKSTSVMMDQDTNLCKTRPHDGGVERKWGIHKELSTVQWCN